MQVGGMPARALTLKGPETYQLTAWNRAGHAARVKTLRKIAMEYGRDPRIPVKVVEILKASGAQPRQYDRQAAALLKWVQDNVYYVNEPDERLQSPEYTLRVAHGDCDDLAILLGAFYESIGLPWRFVLSGFQGGKPMRWVEGSPLPPGVNWTHIYVKVGWPPGRPQAWLSAEPTIKGVPLGWDVVDALRRGEKIPLPEMSLKGGALAGIAAYGMVPALQPVVFPVGNVQPIFSAIQEVKDDVLENLTMKKLIVTVVVGSVTTVATGLLAAWIQAKVFGGKKGHRRNRGRGRRR